jgi:anti-sigma B factor antagonist
MSSPLARPAPLDLDVQRSEERTLVTVSGELDAATASYLYGRLAELEMEGVTNVVLDLARLNFMDSTGLGVIVTEHKRMQRIGGTLTIFSPSSPVRRLFEITGLADHLDIVPAKDEPWPAK